VVTDARAAELEAPELAGYADLWAAAPEPVAAQLGLGAARCGEARAVAAAAHPGVRLVNHVLGLPAERPLEAEVIAALERFFARHGGPALIALREGALGEELLTARGYRPDYAWIKFARGMERPAAAATDLAVRALGPADGPALGALLAATFGMPEAFAAWFATLPGRRGWHCFGAHDGPDLVASGTLFAGSGAGWLSFGATDPAYRGRGAHKALFAARIERARALGLRRLVVETGEQAPGRPDPSYRNIVAAGFRPVFRRPFWRGRDPVSPAGPGPRAA
jgi:GNAT superfamily N-acetyltransferase